MTKRLSDRKNPQNHDNCITEERTNVRANALKLKALNDKYESKQTYVVLKIDHKTTYFKRVKNGVIPKDAEIHKGRI